jgi:hypothetical protein
MGPTDGSWYRVGDIKDNESGKLNVKKRLLMTRQEYSVLMDDIKYDECG